MRINKYVALASGLSRRAADHAINDGKVLINNKLGSVGDQVDETDTVYLNGKKLKVSDSATTILLNKPVGYVCSRDGQGAATIYELLPEQYQKLKPAGRLDKDSSGLVILSNDGDLIYKLSHPSRVKDKVYLVTLNKKLSSTDQQRISQNGIDLEDGVSILQLTRSKIPSYDWKIIMHEGRNRQIRRTFEAAGYNVISLHRIQVADYKLEGLKAGEHNIVAF